MTTRKEMLLLLSKDRITKFSRKPSYTQEELNTLKQDVKYDDHLIDLDDLCFRYGTDVNKGLSHNDAAARLHLLGPNKLTPPKVTPQILVFAKNLVGGFAIMLWIASVLCFVVYTMEKMEGTPDAQEHFYLGCILLLVIFVSATFTYIQERKTSKIMEAFKTMVPAQTTVIRQGQRIVVSVEDLVLGDLVLLRTGDRIPADVRIVEANSLGVDNSSLTGEAEPQPRSAVATHGDAMETANLAFFSTTVTSGSGKGIVIACGDSTEMGRVAELATGLREDITPIAKEIQNFIRLLTILAVITGGLVFVLAVSMGYSWMESVVIFLGIVVACVPEGMLITFTMCLSISAKHMADQNCLVKNMEAVETLGSTSVICSDKTGTLTTNSMTVSHIWVDGNIFTVDFADEQSSKVECDTSSTAFQALWFVCAMCNKAEFLAEQQCVKVHKRAVSGDASESALLKFAEASLGSVAEKRQSYPRVLDVPFSSVTKFQLSIHQDGDGHRLVMKGAPERVLEHCSTTLIDENEVSLDKKTTQRIMDACLELASQGERVLACADLALSNYPLDYVSDVQKENYPTKGLRLVGLVSLIDPPRPSVPYAVDMCRRAGIKVTMVTGDHPVTAKAIARQVRIISPGSLTEDEFHQGQGFLPEEAQERVKAKVITGDKLKAMAPEELDMVLIHYPEVVFARTSPTQKLMIVEAYQRLKYIVAVTGDGVNDSPAMKQANLGIAMGITGTDVARRAADMVLLDDNFSTIVVGIEEGRRIFDNLKKSVAFTLTASTPEVLPFICSTAFHIPLPLSITAVMCINYLSDIWPAISLVFEKAESDIMRRKPRDPQHDKLVNSRMLSVTYIQIGFMQAAAGFYTYFFIMAEHGFLPETLLGILGAWENPKINNLQDSFGNEWTYEDRKVLEYTCNTAYFVAIVFSQWADVIICKTRRLSIFQQGMSNWPLNWGIIIQTVLVAAVIYIPGVQIVLKLYPLKWYWWILSFPFCLLIILYDEMRRYFIRKYPGGFFERETYY